MREDTLDTAVRQLGRLVGTWTITGHAAGVAAFRWYDGGLIQEATVDLDGIQLIYTQIITQRRRDDDSEIVSRLYTLAGPTIDHVVQVSQDVITGSPTTVQSPPCAVTLAPDDRSFVCQWKDAWGEREILATKVDEPLIVGG